MKYYSPREETPEGVIEDLETVHGRTRFFPLISGGKDSISTCHWLADQGKLDAAVHIQTNIGIKQTTDFVKDLCQGNLWFGSPFFYKTTEETYRYIHENGLRITPVHDILGMSGECMCGSFATFGGEKNS